MDAWRTHVGVVAGLFFLMVGGCSDEPEELDAGLDATVAVCSSDSDCDDGLYCTGPESCDPSASGADARGCVAGAMPCESMRCVEDEDRCMPDVDCDQDNDGHDAIACGGDDCDDRDPDRFPGNVEVCDGTHDEDCDPSTLGPDLDEDGHPGRDCCNADASGTLRCGQDCDDARDGVGPGQSDGCGGGDEDCDGFIDEEPDSTYYRDADNDGWGRADDIVRACALPAGYAVRVGDCLDEPDPSAGGELHANEVHPGATEICNGRDDNCSGVVDDVVGGCSCTIGQTRSCAEGGFVGECASGRQTCEAVGWGTCSIAPVADVCNGLDDNCDGTADEGTTVGCYVDTDRDGYAAEDATASEVCPAVGGGCPDGFTATEPTGTEIDCMPTLPDVRPGGTEVCNDRDDDCDARTDEGVTVAQWADGDDDGYGAGPEIRACTQLIGNVTNADDCDDSDGDVHPGAEELCDDIDHDCDTQTDEDDADAETWCSARPNVDSGGAGCRVRSSVVDCEANCQFGWGDCDRRMSGADPANVNGCETDLTRPENCGGCGRVCAAGQVCTDGSCRCPDGTCTLNPGLECLAMVGMLNQLDCVACDPGGSGSCGWSAGSCTCTF